MSLVCSSSAEPHVRWRRALRLGRGRGFPTSNHNKRNGFKTQTMSGLEFVIPVHAEDLELVKDDRIYVVDARAMEELSPAEYKQEMNGATGGQASHGRLRLTRGTSWATAQP